MKVDFSSINIKLYLLLWIFGAGFSSGKAQDKTIDHYLKNTGDYAGIFNGKIESGYNSNMYTDFPYYGNNDFTDGVLLYNDCNYPDVKLRLDLYKEQLIVLSPQKRYGIIIDPENVERINLHNQVFLWLSPPQNSGLKNGYYRLMFEGKQLKLLCKEKYFIQKGTSNIHFDLRTKHYIQSGENYHQVKDKGSFTKLFPMYKKQINQFAKDKKLNFRKNKDFSLNTLSSYCEELINSNSK